MDNIEFQKEMVPIYNKIVIEKNVGFPIIPLRSYSEYYTLYNYIYNGIIYKFFLQIEKKEVLSYEEYIDLCEGYLNSSVFFGVKTIYYGEAMILTSSKYTVENGSVITPIYDLDVKRLEERPNIPFTKEQLEKSDAIIKESERWLARKE